MSVRKMSKEEQYIYATLNKELKWKNPKVRAEYVESQRVLMEKRRKQGKTQAAQRSYMERNREALNMYATLINQDLRLQRKGHKGYNSGR